MVTKKVRTEYMKKFKDPKWETFSKCYEDSLKYRLTRRVMEHSHKPWFWEGWDSGSESSGWTTPRLTRNRVAPLSVPLPPPIQQRPEELRTSPGAERPSQGGEADAAAAVTEDAVNKAAAPATSGPAEGTASDSGPADSTSSDGDPPKRRHRRRTPRSEPGRGDDGKPPVARKALRAKSQPPTSTKENRRPSSRLDWAEGPAEVRRSPNDSHTADACAQTRRGSDKRGSQPERRRARSADLEKLRRSQPTVADDRWVTEYMRCFSARLR